MDICTKNRCMYGCVAMSTQVIQHTGDFHMGYIWVRANETGSKGYLCGIQTIL